VSDLAVGPDPSVTATYSGARHYAPSTSTPAVVAVTTAPTTTSLTASASPVTVGTAVSVHATVVSSTSGVPQGLVTVTDGTTVLGTLTLATGSGSLTLSSLPIGTHHLVATYHGSTDYAASTSAVVTVVMTAVPPPPAVLAPVAKILALTGLNIQGLVACGVGLLVLGLLAALATRRRATHRASQ